MSFLTLKVIYWSLDEKVASEKNFMKHWKAEKGSYKPSLKERLDMMYMVSETHFESNVQQVILDRR